MTIQNLHTSIMMSQDMTHSTIHVHKKALIIYFKPYLTRLCIQYIHRYNEQEMTELITIRMVLLVGSNYIRLEKYNPVLDYSIRVLTTVPTLLQTHVELALIKWCFDFIVVQIQVLSNNISALKSF